MEYLGQVLSLSKQVINGYKTMNSVLVDTNHQAVHLLNHELYSTGMDNYIGQTVVDTIKGKPEFLSTLTPAQIAAFEANEHVNTKILYKKNLAQSSQVIKQVKPWVKYAIFPIGSLTMMSFLSISIVTLAILL